jgi:hypothetical protein
MGTSPDGSLRTPLSIRSLAHFSAGVAFMTQPAMKTRASSGRAYNMRLSLLSRWPSP